MLQGIYDNYARIINSRLNARLRTNCEITVESVEEQHYYEFSNALTEGDVLALTKVQINEARDTPAKIFLSTTTVMTMMDRMMGGEGEVDDSLAFRLFVYGSGAAAL